MKLTKKLFIAIMTMALLVVTFTSSTFAWFTLGTTGKIEDVQVNVTAGTGMEISKDGNSWKNVIQLENPQGLNFTAVTTLDGKTFYDAEHGLLDDYDTTGATPVIKTTSAEGKNVMFYEQKFFVRIRKTDLTAGTSSITKILLSQANGNLAANETLNPWTADVSLGTALGTNAPVYTHYKGGNDNADAIIEGQERTFDALNAVKVAFSTTRSGTDTVTVFYGYEAETTSWGTMPALAARAGENAGYEVNSGLAYDYAEAKGYEIMANAQPYEIDPSATAFPAYVSYTSSKENITEAEKAKVTVLSNATNSSDFVDADTAKAANGILENKTLDDNYLYAEVTIRIWLDGWDPDCINAILGQKKVFTFQLKAEE